MKKKYLLIIAILIILFYFVQVKEVNAPPSSKTEYCTGAVICPGPSNPDLYNFSVNCKSQSDGFCPENYSKTLWGDCPDVTVGKCLPCDPDCNKCPNVTLMVSKCIDVGDPIGLLLSVDHSKEVTSKIYRADASHVYNKNEPLVTIVPRTTNDPGSVYNPDCKAVNPNYDPDRWWEFNQSGKSPCQTYYNDTTNPLVNEGGNWYCYLADIFGGAAGEKTQGDIESCGYVRPGLNLSFEGSYLPNIDICPNGICEIGNNNQIEIGAKVSSKVGITYAAVYLYAKDKRTGELRYVNLNTDYGSRFSDPDYCSTRCPSTGCEPLVEYSDPGASLTSKELIGNIDGTLCENKEFIVEVIARDGNFGSGNCDEGRASYTLKLTNSEPKCTDDCPIFSSKTLQLTLARVSTWLLGQN